MKNKKQNTNGKITTYCYTHSAYTSLKRTYNCTQVKCNIFIFIIEIARRHNSNKYNYYARFVYSYVIFVMKCTNTKLHGFRVKNVKPFINHNLRKYIIFIVGLGSTHFNSNNPTEQNIY